jgi:putative hydrolase of the HAD superfamily
MDPMLRHIDNWIFDLDNTLYPADCALFELIDNRMRAFIANLLTIEDSAAHVVQKTYFRDHGTTLSGLMANHGVEPAVFLDFVHDIEMDRLASAPRLRQALQSLPGRKIIFTNGDAVYAGKVLAALGLTGVFDDICDIHHMEYRPKPHDAAYHALLARTGIDPKRSVFIEDMARNLEPAKKLGMTTIWINNGSEYGCRGAEGGHIDHEAPDLAEWLNSIAPLTVN